MRTIALPLILFAVACGDDGGSKQTDSGVIDIDSQDIDAAPTTPTSTSDVYPAGGGLLRRLTRGFRSARFRSTLRR